MSAPTTPVVVEENGWTVESSSVANGGQTADQIRDVLRSGLTLPDAPPDADGQAPAPDTPPTSTAVAAEPETGTVAAAADPQGEDTGTVDATADATADADPTDKGKKKTPAGQRIKELQAQLHAATRETREAERLAADRRRELEALDRAAEQRRAALAEGQPAKDAEPTWAAYEEAGKSWDEYQKAFTTWMRADLAREQNERIAEARRIADEEAKDRAHDARIRQVELQHPDFEEKVLANLKDVPHTQFMQDVVHEHPAGAKVLLAMAEDRATALILSDITKRATNPIMHVVRELEDPIPLLKYFASNVKEFDRLTHMQGASALVALGQVVARLDGANKGSPSPAPTITSAAPPIRPVAGQRGTGVVAQTYEDLPFGPEALEAFNREEAEKARRRHY